MINPFSFFSFLYSLSKDSPEPVNIQYEEPMPSLFPPELRDKAEIEGFFTSQVWIENLSGRVLDNIRINLTAPLSYAPIVRTNKIHRTIEYSYDHKTYELTFKRLDPKEALRVTFFPSLDFISLFKKPQIIIDNQEISKAREFIGFCRKYPFYTFGSIIFLILIISSLTFTGYNILRYNGIIDKNSDISLMNQANERMKGYGCPLKVGIVDEQLKETVKNTFGYPSVILQFNGAKSVNELWAKEKIVYLDCSHN
ncbi:hypothetical protein Phpb_04439 [Photorhabdus namnaonensis]|uniref:Uncharacterized protein n=2 Tax=Photorhabdus namnaonensis TaxID=1851568 RepID=A0A1B8YBV3_9GAMM|nr:hypothetical protein Phpb_04439 [Photorhabdus namnaonensis]